MGITIFLKPLLELGTSQNKNWKPVLRLDTEICIIIQVSCNSCKCLSAEVPFLVCIPNIYKVNEPFFLFALWSYDLLSLSFQAWEIVIACTVVASK